VQHFIKLVLDFFISIPYNNICKEQREREVNKMRETTTRPNKEIWDRYWKKKWEEEKKYDQFKVRKRKFL
jgi:hypothetical protein